MHKEDILKFCAVGIAAAVTTILILGVGLFLLLTFRPGSIMPVLSALGAAESGTVRTEDSSEAKVIQAVKKANPAVVAITVSKNVPVYERYYTNPFNDFFGNFFWMPQIRQNGTQLQEVGGGSGFLVSPDGYIVTNRHVVSDENAQYTVFTNDGDTYDAQVVARDSVLDIAVLKIEGEHFEHLQFGDSSALEVGQSVIAIGNALAEFRNTVSVGVVSGLSRSIVASDQRGELESLEELIQTDAAINSGNSGGPLLNLSGEVIGVNVAIVSGAQNVGFALSANSVKNIVASVQETGEITRPYLGVRYIPITEALKERNDLPVDHGVLVQRGTSAEELAVIPDSPADKAGILENDIILGVDGTPIDAEHSLSSLIARKKIGDTIRLVVLSKGTQKEVFATIEAMP